MQNEEEKIDIENLIEFNEREFLIQLIESGTITHKNVSGTILQNKVRDIEQAILNLKNYIATLELMMAYEKKEVKLSEEFLKKVNLILRGEKNELL